MGAGQAGYRVSEYGRGGSPCRSSVEGVTQPNSRRTTIVRHARKRRTPGLRPDEVHLLMDAGRRRTPLRGNELRALRQLQRESAGGPLLFVFERRAPFTTAGFAKMVQRAGEAAELDFKAHTHVLRHACGYGRRIRATTSGGIRTLSRARHAARIESAQAGHCSGAQRTRRLYVSLRRGRLAWLELS